MAIRYSDGSAVEARILRLLEKAPELGSLACIAGERYDEWPVRYHLCPERGNLVRHLNFSGLDVLELGAGMGAVSRYLAEQARSLTVVEGTEPRFRALSARLRDLANWHGRIGNIQDVDLGRTFDVVTVIGVLEYSELYISPDGDRSPFIRFLDKAQSCLGPEGVLVLAIENRLGIKYWSGSAEDHTGRVFDGICGYPDGKSPRTFAAEELRTLLHQAGFSHVRFQYPFPDYKIPACVLDEELVRRAPRLAAELACSRPHVNYDRPQVKYFPDLLAAHGVARAGLLAQFANSFLVLASRNGESAVWQRLLTASQRGEVGWHYANDRKLPAATVFLAEPDGGVAVMKRPLREGASQTRFPVEDTFVRWHQGERQSVRSSRSLRERLVRLWYYDRWEESERELVSFLQWARRHFAGPEGGLSGQALDAVVTNALWMGEGRYSLFDLEWEREAPVEPSWWVLRNVLSLQQDRELIPRSAPFTSLRGLYERLCAQLGIEPCFEQDVRREAVLQSALTARDGFENHLGAIDQRLRRPWIPAAFPREPQLEERLFRGLGSALWYRAGRRALRLGLRWYRGLRSAPLRLRRLLPAPSQP